MDPRLQEAVVHLKRLTDREPCSFLSERLATRFETLTCREYMSAVQGVPHPGCGVCQAKEFLAKLEAESPRTVFLDYDARRKPKTAFSCVKCQKDLRRDQPHRLVHMLPNGEPFVVHPEDVSKTATEVHPIGMDCAKSIGLEWTVEPS